MRVDWRVADVAADAAQPVSAGDFDAAARAYFQSANISMLRDTEGKARRRAR
jgi:hypothetical protein